MRLILALSLLTACQPLELLDDEPISDVDEVEDTSYIDTEICFVGESAAGSTNALGEACAPAPQTSLPYSMLGPNVMLVVDRSGSMQGGKWNELQSLIPYIPMVGARANIGLTFFPAEGEDACDTEGATVVDVTEGSAGAADVADALRYGYPEGRTPIADTLTAITRDPGISCTNRDNIVVLLSDGEESCNGDPTEAARALTGGAVPVELFVIGFATTSGANTQLSAIAAAAEPTTGPGNFYEASSVDQLLERLYTVTATCTAQLDSAVAASDLRVSFDGTELELCTEDRCEEGFTYDEDHATVTLEGRDCLALQDGQCHELDLRDE
ncbi:MAG: VWA domain-containing protein [Proteobacteria bacterium]|nr:VWA domain-containing protein [Pseudomonadota bacterium]